MAAHLRQMTYAVERQSFLTWQGPYQEVRMNAYPPVVHLELHRAGRAEELGRAALSAIALGDWPRASEAADGCVALSDPRTQPESLARGEAAAGIVAAVRGDSTAARSLLGRSEAPAVRHGWTELVDVVRLGRGIEALTADRYDEAWAQLRQLIDFPAASSVWIRLLAVGFLAETGLRCGSEVAAGAVLAAVERQNPAQATPTPASASASASASAPELVGVTAYAHAVTEYGKAGDEAFDRALAGCPGHRAFDRARIHLARGMWLRRDRRITESRQPLHEALVVFERLEARAWADRASSELRATGERRSRPGVGEAGALTAQELQIVQMAAAGMTNREIGQRLYLSHRTIGSHLYRAFPKLGIVARSQLRDVLADLGPGQSTMERAAR
jgi:DNA-binding CsgD family transcriptional regulator